MQMCYNNIVVYLIKKGLVSVAKSIIGQLRQYIADGEKEVSVNFINTGAKGPKVKQLLEDAGYVSDAPGCPQQTFTLQDQIAEED